MVRVYIQTPPTKTQQRETGYVFLCLIVFSLLYWLWGQVSHYQELEGLHFYTGFYYNYIIVYPITSIGEVWDWLQKLNITTYKNISFCLNVLIICLYGSLLGLAYAISLTILNEFKKGLTQMLIVLPAFASLVWFIMVEVIISWLFA